MYTHVHVHVNSTHVHTAQIRRKLTHARGELASNSNVTRTVLARVYVYSIRTRAHSNSRALERACARACTLERAQYQLFAYQLQ